MHIGLIGGIGPAATDYYYRGLIGKFEGAAHALELTIAHADAPTLIRHLANNEATVQAKIFEQLTHRLKSAGAQAVVVTSISGHFCVREFEAVSPLPVINMLDSVASWLTGKGYQRVGIMGTKTVMQTRMYGRLPTPEVLIPAGDDLERVHQNYVDMAIKGVVTEAQRQAFFECGRGLAEQGADAVLLGGTDLFLAFDGRDCGFEVVDCALLHLEDVAEAAAR